MAMTARSPALRLTRFVSFSGEYFCRRHPRAGRDLTPPRRARWQLDRMLLERPTALDHGQCRRGGATRTVVQAAATSIAATGTSVLRAIRASPRRTQIQFRGEPNAVECATGYSDGFLANCTKLPRDFAKFTIFRIARALHDADDNAKYPTWRNGWQM
jgi:hypothetical protein